MPRGRPPVERVTLSCAACGKEIQKRKSDAARNKTGRWFCSRECQFSVGSRPRRKAMRQCEQCGEEFYPLYGGRRVPRFCSRACSDAWQRRNRVIRTCEVCGRDFSRPPSWKTRQRARFCSKDCESLGKAKRKAGHMHNGRPAVIDNSGYVRVHEPDHPAAYKNGQVFEHRLVMENFLGRRLATSEHVHHVNGNKTDNRLENLVIMDHLEHLALSGSEYRRALAEMQDELAGYRKRYGLL